MGCHILRTFLCSFVFPEMLKKLTLSLYSVLSDMIFLLAVQPFEGDIEV